MNAGRVRESLNSKRAAGEPPVTPFPDRDSFAPAKGYAILGVSGQAMRATICRHGLAVEGAGRARRYPWATVEELLALRARGAGPETINHYVRALRGFMRWMVKARRVGANPLDTLTLQNAKADVRRHRRELTEAELRTLLDATRASGHVFRGLTGEDRFHLYLTAATTGFRANALANLTPGDFALECETPVITLAARFNKSRKPKVQPLPADVAAELRARLSGKPAGEPVWGGRWARDKRGAEMLRGDLDAPSRNWPGTAARK